VSATVPVSREITTSLSIPLRRAKPKSGGTAGLQLAALRAPLVVKLVGANLAVVAILVAGWLMTGHPMSAAIILALVGVIAIHLLLVLVALRPIRDLDAVASRVWRGDFGARVKRSAVADQEVLRVGAMFNILWTAWWTTAHACAHSRTR